MVVFKNSHGPKRVSLEHMVTLDACIFIHAKMSQMLTSTRMPVYQGLFEYRIARENMSEFFGVTLFNGAKYDKARMTHEKIMFYKKGVCVTWINRIF